MKSPLCNSIFAHIWMILKKNSIFIGGTKPKKLKEKTYFKERKFTKKDKLTNK